ncbi:MAG: hypothetical protein CTY10_02590 [Methylotenera sp.]|nr:MAG: hypothetical protein CTY10_02590 [Methylotenera sp.]
MKPLNARFKSILKTVLIILTLIALLVISWVAYINFRGDEEPDAGRDTFYVRSKTTIPDNQNLAVTISGINAPIGTDITSHGRLVIDAYESDLFSSSLKSKVIKSISIKFTGKREEFDCWLNDGVSKTAEICASEDRIRKLLEENKLLIERYKKLYQMPSWQGSIQFGGQSLLDINRLLVADIKLGVDSGSAEAAYQKWKANALFINHVLKQETTVIEKAIFLVIDGFNFASLEYLLLKKPQIMTNHYDELIVLLKPTGLIRYNLQGMLRAEYYFFEDHLFKKVTAEQNVHINYIRNRIYRVHIDFLKEAQKSPYTFKESQRKLHKRYYFGRYQFWNYDLLDPQHSLISNMLINGFLNGFNLVGSMQSKSALIKLLNLKINIHQQKIADSNIQAFLNNAGSEYFNPFTNKPMRWDGAKRMIICDRPDDTERRVEVRL